LQATWETAVSQTTRLALTARWFEEERENGTSLQRNASREGFGSVTLKGEPAPAFRWSASLHFQNQNFDSFFSAVNAARTAETPANHQFDVPARTIGMATVGTWSAGGNITTAGIDARHIEGDTNETFLFDGSQFTRLRSAGGTQQFVGAFVNHDRALGTESLRAVAGLRIDHRRNLDGFRREKALANQATLRDDRQPDQSELEISPHFGAVWKINAQWRTRASVYRAFRVPTLNEYHRPFRVGIIATEANPALREESLTGAEIGADFTTRRFRAGFTVFGNRFEDAVANVTLSRTPTAINRQRQNLDRLDIVGIEANAEWNPTRSLRIAVDLLQSDATVERARAQPALEGRRLAQVPRQCATASVDWTAAERVVISVRARRASEQFEDDENLLPLAPATTVDAQVRWQFREDLQFFAALENAFDENVQTGRSNEDIISLGPPRNLRAGFRATW
jgi:outer membrane receptor protein involved in Fe transport